jgi:AraC-like DNA-binding protein
MEELAAVARMGVSTLHHQFRGLGAMSPLQYQKQLRLQTARQRMLMDGIDATSAAYEVGYDARTAHTSTIRRKPKMKASAMAERIAAAVWESTPGGASRLPSLATFASDQDQGRKK